MRKTLVSVSIALSPLAAAGVALFCGSCSVSARRVAEILLGGPLQGGITGSPEAAIVWDVRMPRIVLAALVGGALSTSGVTLQGVFRNPLVDPFLLGISAGAAFGCALSTAFFPQLPLQPAAFVFSLAASLGSYLLARNRGEVSRLHLVLSGVVVSAFFTALVSILKLTVDPHKLASIVYWVMGSFSLADWPSVWTASAGIAAGCLPLYLARWRLNAMSMGDEEARTLGVRVERDRFFFVAASSLAVGAAVSVSGIIGWVGLMVPHLVRMAAGPDHRRLMPFSMAAGAAFTILADTLARNLTAFDVPVGIVTALGGAPFFFYLLKRGGGENWGR